jgi:hypothetical protein
MANYFKTLGGIDRFFDEGRAADSGFTAKDADPEQLRRGARVELEHTSDLAVARKIALDHLAEFPGYYDGLKKMEELLEAGVPPKDWGKK